MERPRWPLLACLVIILAGCTLSHNAPAGIVPAPLPRARTRVPVAGEGKGLTVGRVIDLLSGCAPLRRSIDSVPGIPGKIYVVCEETTPPTGMPP